MKMKILFLDIEPDLTFMSKRGLEKLSAIFGKT